MTSPSPLPTPHPRILGRYALYDEIASGGMATVHIGRLLGPVGFSRMVAIKRLHPQYAKEPEFVSMFLDEARLAARVRHPNVVGTLDVVHTEGELFLVMEYVQGESLAPMMRALRERGEGMPIPIAVAIAVDVLEGLHSAHEATSDLGEPLGIVHRDVSPQNILVGTDGVARVVDFGVAKAAGRVQTTRDGQLKGKLGYMAPEQIRGIATRATDVHAVSVVLWEMLTARRLYHAETDVQTFSNILAGTGIIAASKLAPLVSPALDRVILRGLQANPDERFPTAREMARALTNAAPPASPSDVGDWVASMAAKNLSSRALKIAAIESSGALPAAGSSPDPLDASPFSHPPVSVERLRSLRPPRAAMVLVPVALATIGLGATIGLFVRTPTPKAAAASVEHARPLAAWAPPEKAAPPPVLPSSVAEVVAPPASSIPTIAVSALAPPDLHHVVRSIPVARPVAVPTAAPPQTPIAKPPAQGANDFAHVMDSRK